MIAFLDTSAFACRYLPERGSNVVRALFRGQRDLSAARVAYVELAAAVARAAREGKISDAQRDAVIARLPTDFADLEVVVEPTRGLWGRSVELVLAHGLRAYDAMQLAAFLQLRARSAAELWASDGQLLAAARAEGVKVVAV